MNLPNYFLADLPPEAALTPTLVSEACQALKRNRACYLAERPTASLVRTLSQVGRDWLTPGYPFRQMALEQGPAATGFSRPTLEQGLEAFFSQLTEETLAALVLQDLGHGDRLDQFAASDPERRLLRASTVHGHELLVHITGGVLPPPTLSSMVFGLLTRSAQFLKCASGTSFLPRLFAHSVYEADPKLGACLELAEWKGGWQPVEDALFAQADAVTATGSDETLAAIRPRLPARVRLLGYGHKVSFGYIAREMLSPYQAAKTAAAAARDVAAWDQLGCLSPHAFYVERNGDTAVDTFAELLASELERLERAQPRGRLEPAAAGAIAYRRSFYEVRMAHLPDDTRLWCSPGSTAWTVVFENDPLFQMSCLNRFIYVKAVDDVQAALRGADSVRGQVSTVGLAAPETQANLLSKQFARWGVTRVCPLGRMQSPPLPWRHDGQPALADLVTWTDREY